MDKTTLLTEINHLCIRYTQMFNAEQLVKRAISKVTSDILYKAYLMDKQLYDKQYDKVKGLIDSI